MKILMATSEFTPFANTGQLGDDVQLLASALKKLGHDVIVALPYYRSIREGKFDVKPAEIDFQVGIGGKRASGNILETKTADQIPVYLIRRDEYFDRTGIYMGDGRPYEDNSERFIFFAKAAIELAQRLPAMPEIIDSHDWPAALVPVFVKDRELPFRTVLTAHELEHQGSFWGLDFGLTGLPGNYVDAKGVEFYGRLNFLKGGILFADAVTLPGEPALFQALNPKHGFGLDGVLAENRNRIFGIPHGIDYSAMTNGAEPGSKRSKDKNKDDKKSRRQNLLSQLGLSKDIRGPIFVLPVEAGDDEALESVSPILDLLLTDDTALIISGELPESAVEPVLIAERKYPSRFSFLRNGNVKLSPLALSAADLVLLPSSLGFRGSAASLALKAGTLPIVKNREGLYQLVPDFDPSTGQGVGFVYTGQSPEALWDGVSRAKFYYGQPETWSKLAEKAQALDFSWKQSATLFAKLYGNLLRHKAP
jgi:starch synthase